MSLSEPPLRTTAHTHCVFSHTVQQIQLVDNIHGCELCAPTGSERVRRSLIKTKVLTIAICTAFRMRAFRVHEYSTASYNIQYNVHAL